MLSIEIFRSPRSTDPTYVRCKPDAVAKASCESPARSRASRRFSAKRRRVFEGFVLGLTREIMQQMMTMYLQTISGGHHE